MAKKVTVTSERYVCSVCSKDYEHDSLAEYCEKRHVELQEEEDRLSECHENNGAWAITRTDIKCVSCDKIFVDEQENEYAPACLGEDTLYKCTHCGHEAYVDHWDVD